MANVTLGPVVLRASATAMMKSMVGLHSWHAAQGLRGHEAAVTLYRSLCQYVMARPDTLELNMLAAEIAARLGALQREQHAHLPAPEAYAQRIRAFVRNHDDRAQLAQTASQIDAWLHGLAASAYGRLAARALELLAELGASLPGAQPFRDAYVTIAPPGQASTGQYVPWLAAVAVQIDTILRGPFPQLEFVETLLHEQVHAVIHERMGDDGEHYQRLPWLNELAAITLSQYALGRAYADLRDEPALAQLPDALRISRAQQEWGDLASAVLWATREPLVGWRAWQIIFARGAYARRNFAHRELLPAILAEAGWPASFPFHYGAHSVDCRDDWVG